LGLFKPATPEQRRLKLYVYGPSGVGKTITALNFPDPAVLDTDGGTAWYTQHFKFKRLQTTDVDEIHKAVDELIVDPSGVKTLVIDSFTKYYEFLVEKHIKRLRVKKGNPQYTLQPVDYKGIKGDLRSFINKLLALDLNIIATAQIKPVYSQGEGEFMKILGYEPDSHKDIPYLFDIVLELNFGPGDIRMAKVIKDRTNTLPKEFEFTYQSMVQAMGAKELEREAVQLRTEQNLNKVSNRILAINLNGKKILTAGVTEDTLKALLETIKTIKINENDLRDKLNDDYSVTSLLDLREDEARLLLNSLVENQNTLSGI
jgi:hypothetical protein